MWTISGSIPHSRVVRCAEFSWQIQSHLELSKADDEGNSQSEAFKNLRLPLFMDRNVANHLGW